LSYLFIIPLSFCYCTRRQIVTSTKVTWTCIVYICVLYLYSCLLKQQCTI